MQKLLNNLLHIRLNIRETYEVKIIIITLPTTGWLNSHDIIY
jgi:hypothetical protein